ncbi:MAG: single-stranded DNA-binding protein [Bacilli bacterium]
MNAAQLIGRPVKDIELSYTQNGMAIAVFTLAVPRSYTNKQTNEKESDFIRCKAFQKTAETLANHVKKGHKVGIQGQIQTGSYEDKDGKKVFTTDIIVQQVTFLEKKDQGGQYVNQQTHAQYQPTGQGVVQPQQAMQPQTTQYQQPQMGQFQQHNPAQYVNAQVNQVQPIDISDEDLPF